MSARFYVFQASGYMATQGAGSGGGVKREVPVAFYILDRAYCHRVVDVFPKAGHWKVAGRPTSERYRVQAAARCAELNRWAKHAVVPSDAKRYIPRLVGV